LPGDLDRSRGRLLEAGDQAQTRGLAAAGRSQEGMEGAALQRERDPIDRGDVAEMLADLRESNVESSAMIGSACPENRARLSVGFRGLGGNYAGGGGGCQSVLLKICHRFSKGGIPCDETGTKKGGAVSGPARDLRVYCCG
jgi:hypothetical protein